MLAPEPDNLRTAAHACNAILSGADSAITNSAGQRCVSHSAIAAGRGDVMCSRPLVPGDSAAASLVPGLCPPAAWADRGRPKRGGRGRTGDLGPCRPGPTPAAPPRGSANVRIARGKGTRRGTRTGRRPKGTTGERRTKGNHPKAGDGDEPRRANGKPEESPPGEPGGREVRPQTTRVKARGFGAARISDAAAESGQVYANRA